MDDRIVEAVGMALCQSALGGRRYPCRETGKFNCADAFPGQQARAALSAARPVIEAAWRDGWHECKARLTDDEAFCLTDDVEEDAWDDSKTAAAIRALAPSDPQ